MDFLRDLINNFALLIVLVFAYSRILRYFRSNDLYKQLMNGMLFSIISLAVMSFSVELEKGLVFDTRSVVISASGLFGGPISACITILTASLQRLAKGGVGAATGVAVILSSGVLGVGYHYVRKKYHDAMHPFYILAFSLFVHVVMLGCMFIMPAKIAWATIHSIGWAIISVYPVISFVIITLLRDVESRINLEETFQKNLENYENLVENSNSIILRIKPDSTITFINDFAQTFFGFAPDELIGKSVIGTLVVSVNDSSDAAALSAIFQDICFTPEKNTQNETESLRKDGSRCWITWSNKPVFDKNGELTEVICVGVEITQRKMLEFKLEENNAQLEKLNKRFRLAVDSANIGVWELNLSDNSLLWDKAMYGIYGLTPDTFKNIYESWRATLHPDDSQEIEDALRKAISENKDFESEFRIIRPNGEIRNIKAFGQITRDLHNQSVMTGVNYDVTELKKTRETLLESELRYSQLFKNMTVGFASHKMIYDKNGKPCDYRFLQVNPAFEKMTGFVADEIIGKTVNEILPGTESYWIEEYGKVARTGKPESYSNYSKELDKYFDVWAFSPGQDLFGVIVSDITEQKRMEQRRDLSTKVLAALNTNGESRDIIDKLVDLFKDYSGADGVGIRIREGNDFPYYFAKGFSDDFIKSEKYLLSHCGNMVQEFECLCGSVISKNLNVPSGCSTDSGSLWVNSLSNLAEHDSICKHYRGKCQLSGYESLALIPILKDREIIGMIQFNYFERDRISRDFVEFIESIGQSIGIALDRIENFLKLEEARQKAEAASRTKSEFLATISHEIRTPLNGIIGFCGLIEETVRQSIECNQRHEILEYLKTVNECGRSLTEIINDILEISSIEAGQFAVNLESFNPRQLLEDSLKIFRFRLNDSKVALNFQPGTLPPFVKADAKRLKQIIFNLVGNSIKFTPSGQIDVTAVWVDQGLKIAVKDTGIGIPEDVQKKIFEPFTQADQSYTRIHGGTGLGLTIVSRVLENLGGLLSVDSVPGKGTTITFIFPAETTSASAEESESSAAEEHVQSVKNVLVIEDNNISAFYLDNVLKKIGVNYQIAESFAEMQEICASGFVPDVALIDIALPDADGFVCREWLKNKFGDSIKCFAQTAHVLKEHTESYSQAGFDGFIGKPYKKDEIIKLVTNAK